VEVTLPDESQQKRFCRQAIIALFKNAHDYCKSCDVCQAYVRSSTVTGPLHPNIPPLRPFEKWAIDLMGPLPMIRRKHRFIVIAIDYLTKFVEVCALKS
jgi:hypothetical protein